jgi:uncharacterized protein YegP (UPF0339 family)
MNKPRFEVYEDEAGEWRWRLIAGNGRTVATGESHESSRDAHRAVADVRAIVALALPQVKVV